MTWQTHNIEEYQVLNRFEQGRVLRLSIEADKQVPMPFQPMASSPIYKPGDYIRLTDVETQYQVIDSWVSGTDICMLAEFRPVAVSFDKDTENSYHAQVFFV